MEFFLFIIFYGLSIVNCSILFGFNLYHTDHLLNNHDHDCLYYFPPIVTWDYQFIQYCIRDQIHKEVLFIEEMDTDDNSFTFEVLRNKNITSQQLYEWSAPIDLIEHYENYLENNISTNQFLFYNCTYPWFGSQCEYRFKDVRSDFNELVEWNFELIDYPPFDNSHTLSCYIHVQCDRTGNQNQTSSACLDWREVCNGKVDCIDGGHDEKLCWQLEINECDNKTEFRCHNGLCIPFAFLRDDEANPDCLDRSDEPFKSINVFNLPSDCFQHPAFRCEEHMCHPLTYKNDTIECGDGSCMPSDAQCVNQRSLKLQDALWMGTNISDNCRLYMKCFTELAGHKFLYDYCQFQPSIFIKNIQQHCPKIIELPPILFGHVRFIYTNNQSKGNFITDIYQFPDYICYDGKLCDDNIFPTMFHSPIDLFGNNSTCRSLNKTSFYDQTYSIQPIAMNYFSKLFGKCSNYNQLSSIWNHSNLYRCINSSKIISQHRLLDGIVDCLYEDDESYQTSCTLTNFNHRFKCNQNNNTKCLAHLRVLDKTSDCLDESDEQDYLKQSLEPTISFQIMCDGYTELFPMMIDGRNETDETECTYFPCNNTYTRCDGYWNCLNGADEVNCEWPSICPALHHMCLSPSIPTNFTCLYIERINDGIIDCLGASDERQNCRDMNKSALLLRYQCWNTSQCVNSRLVWNQKSICSIDTNILQPYNQQLYDLENTCRFGRNLTHIQQLFCSLTDLNKMTIKHFSLIGSTSHAVLEMPIPSSAPTLAIVSEIKMQNDPIFDDDSNIKWYCNRGLLIHRLINKQNTTEKFCLCPPAYYGHLCQFQNQRVSLTMQVKASFDFHDLFIIIITLRDDRTSQIESYDQMNYLYERDCRQKFNIYLLYSTRPKTSSTNYSVHIDIFNKQTLDYRASWLFPIRFSFLPVYRMTIQLEIPSKNLISPNCPMLNCGNHGRCYQYTNTKTFFCLCNKGWSGIDCNIPYTCNCSLDSFCFAPQICICPIEKFGPRCYLKHSKCSCENNGTCISDDERMGNKKEYRCICPIGFSGPTCAILDTRITISFASEIRIPSDVLVHLIRVFGKNISHFRSTIPKTIPFDHEILSIFWSIPFHIIFIEIIRSKQYYLTVLQEVYISSANISSTLKHSDRCLNINEIFNETILGLHPLRRIKYYHIPCQNQTNLRCFYDDIHMCICNKNLSQSNCMIFNHTLTYKCDEHINPCENQGKCFRDSPTCPTSFMCVCNECSYGSNCQISTKGFGLSLDVILGYHIKPNLSFKNQRFIIHFTTILVTLMLIIGFICSILSILTFHRKKTHETGCGYYLLISSYISILTIIFFSLKFYFLLVSQMGIITNRIYLKLNCILFEYLLKIFVSISDWLNAFVGIERAFTVWKDTKFNKKKTKKLAKKIIISIFLITILSYIYDPIYRDLIDDIEDNRTWCHVQFNNLSLELLNTIILIFHFSIPFLFSILSAIIIIITTARQKFLVHKKQQSYREQLHKQLYKLKHLLISPIILIILALPRLIISFLSGCMKTTREDPWLYLIGYIISFLPPMLLIIVFILPSEIYKEEFKNTIARIQKYIPRRVQS